MKKQQILLAGVSLALLLGLYFFAPVTPKPAPKPVAGEHHEGDGHDHGAASDSIPTGIAIVAAAKEKLTEAQLAQVTRLENAVVRGDVKDQQINVYQQLAAYWRDSIRSFMPFAYYTSEAAKLENSEKNLTFAANLLLSNVQVQENPALKTWMAREAKQLFEKVLVMNPSNDSAQVGLGSCYFFGNVGGMPMEGIAKIREVTERNPNYPYAHFMLGVGSMISGQLDKAAERFEKVIQLEPTHLEALLRLAEVYELQNKKAEAIQLYEQSKTMIQNPDFVKAVDERIQTLK